MCGCMGMFGGPPWGIPIEEETHELYSEELKQAWETFDAWWKADREGPARRSDMPDDVAAAMELICETPIPTMEATGAESCYMVTVNAALLD